jgi:hypothetical protein
MLMRRLFGTLAGNLQWPVLIILSGLFALVLAAMRLPAAILLGPMLAAILVAVFGTGTRAPHRLFLIAQAVIGCMIARTIPASIIGEILRNWPLFIAVGCQRSASTGATPTRRCSPKRSPPGRLSGTTSTPKPTANSPRPMRV